MFQAVLELVLVAHAAGRDWRLTDKPWSLGEGGGVQREKELAVFPLDCLELEVSIGSGRSAVVVALDTRK